MVAGNPLFTGTWTMKRFNATVINDVWPEVLFFSLVATMVALVSEKTTHDLSIPNSLLTVLGTVLGLVISFRTSSAYERYQDGRKMWTNIMVCSRNLAQMIWVHVPTNREPKNGVAPPTPIQCIIEKKSMVNLVQAFGVAVKHFLRGEEGVYYRDLYPLISFLPRYVGNEHQMERLPLWHKDHQDDETQQVNGASHTTSTSFSGGQRAQRSTTSSPEPNTINSDTKSDKQKQKRSRHSSFDPEKALPSVESEIPLKPSRNPPKATMYDYIPLLRFFNWCIRKMLHRTRPNESRRRKAKKYATPIESHVPLEIILVLSNYSAYLIRQGLLQPALASGIVGNLTTMQDTLSNLERIANTPLPFAYQAHLRMSLWLYLFFLPFQIFSAFKYLTIPGTAFASFLLLGFLEIGQEIENPFNYDLNDLDLDYFCLSIERELHQITAYSNPDPAEFLYSVWNQPFAPADSRTAEELVKTDVQQYRAPNDVTGNSGMDSIRKTLLKNWKDVDIITRE